MANLFDKFDESEKGANLFDQFDQAETKQAAVDIDSRYKKTQPSVAEDVRTIQQSVLPTDPGPIEPSGEGQVIPQSFAERHVSQFAKDIKPAGKAAGKIARNVIEGVGEMTEFIGTPLVAAMNALGYDPRGGGKYLSDRIGLPEPENAGDRVIGQGVKMIAGTGGLVSLAQKTGQLATAGSATQKVAQALSARPDLQLASAAGSGLAGGTAKEAGADPITQAIAALAGGVASPVALVGGQKLFQSVKSSYASMRHPESVTKVGSIVDAALADKGATVGQVSAQIRGQLVEDIKAAQRRGELDPDVVRRLVDYRMTGLTPTAGPLTLDPGVITRQKNLMKIGVSSKDPALQKLSQIEYQNNAKLIDNINKLGANVAGDNATAANKVIEALEGIASVNKQKIDTLYGAARQTGGRSAQLDPSQFAQRANNLLDDALLGGKLPGDVKNMMNQVAEGKIPFTVDVAEQLKTRIGQLQRATNDKAERMALGMVRQSLDETNLLKGQEIGEESMKAFDAARASNREWMGQVDKIPALKAVIDGVEPDKFMNTYIIGTGKDASNANVARLQHAIKDSPEAMGAVRDNIAQFLKTKALGVSADEVGNFSQAGYNKAIQAIGDQKLRLFFRDQEMKMLKAIGRVASYEKFQPTGSAVNNSNTASTAIAAVLDRIAGSSLARRFIPYYSEAVANPIASMRQSSAAKQMTALPVKTKQQNNFFVPAGAIMAQAMSTEQP